MKIIEFKFDPMPDSFQFYSDKVIRNKGPELT
jgi:hypothetical protein